MQQSHRLRGRYHSNLIHGRAGNIKHQRHDLARRYIPWRTGFFHPHDQSVDTGRKAVQADDLIFHHPAICGAGLPHSAGRYPEKRGKSRYHGLYQGHRSGARILRLRRFTPGLLRLAACRFEGISGHLQGIVGRIGGFGGGSFAYGGF